MGGLLGNIGSGGSGSQGGGGGGLFSGSADAAGQVNVNSILSEYANAPSGPNQSLGSMLKQRRRSPISPVADVLSRLGINTR